MPTKTKGQELQESVLLGLLMNPVTAPLVLPPIIMQRFLKGQQEHQQLPPQGPGPLDYDPEIDDPLLDTYASQIGVNASPMMSPKISFDHNLGSLLGSQLGNMVETGEFNPDYLDYLLQYQASANLNVDFGDSYSVDIGYNQPGPLGKQKYRVGVTVPIDIEGI